MRVVAVNIGKIAQQPWRNGTASAIHKTSVEQVVRVNEMGLEGDEQAVTKNHGGEDKAVLVLPSSAYTRFEVAQPYGFLGENLTIEGLDETDVCLGDRLQIGMLLLEVSQPRSPCWKLDEQARGAQDKKGHFLNQYAQSGHVGFYCRVLAAGSVKQGQQGIWLTRSDERDVSSKITIKALFLAQYFPQNESALPILKKAVKHPALSEAWKQSLTQILNKHA